MMGGMAEFEHSPILAPAESGIAKARAQGKRFGRPNALTLADEYEVGVGSIHRALQGLSIWPPKAATAQRIGQEEN